MIARPIRPWRTPTRHEESMGGEPRPTRAQWAILKAVDTGWYVNGPLKFATRREERCKHELIEDPPAGWQKARGSLPSRDSKVRAYVPEKGLISSELRPGMHERSRIVDLGHRPRPSRPTTRPPATLAEEKNGKLVLRLVGVLNLWELCARSCYKIRVGSRMRRPR
ncbi:hypothetical protein KM043_010359 [Ampulex compressa]|nr:hypothetical protein KM043_010359 [Ampulex compressa]